MASAMAVANGSKILTIRMSPVLSAPVPRTGCFLNSASERLLIPLTIFGPAAANRVLSAVLASFFERRRLDRAERAFLAGRQDLADDEFLRQVGMGPGEEKFVLAARRAMAGCCGLAPELIHPGDTVRALLNLQWDQGFIQDFVFALEKHTGDRLPLAYPPDRQTFRDYLEDLARCRRSAGAPPGS